ncbi:MBL fold metallo-hydrolase [Nonomuraea dietziae]|uniref:MBL fold metallo-hydrolase n=1 Tax=Nonomuraea dietziae TaxID=65515 RepID=UPI0031D19E03
MSGHETAGVRFIGNATTLIRYKGFTLLTDPNFLHRGQRAYLGYGLTSRRLTEPALDISQLPPLDAVVLSHMHGDHWDRVGPRGPGQAHTDHHHSPRRPSLETSGLQPGHRPRRMGPAPAEQR